MQTRVLKASLLSLALALLGCGSSATNSAGGAANGTFNSGLNAGNSVSLRIVVPPSGGAVDLPSTGNIVGRLTFLPGATPGTILTLVLSETAPAGANLDTFSGPVQRHGFYYILWQTSLPFDFARIQSIQLSQTGSPKVQNDISPRVIENDAELVGAELDTYTGSATEHLQEVQGRSSNNQATFEQLDSQLMEPGKDYLFAAKNLQEKTIPVTIVNNSGISPCYVCILGQNPNAVRQGKPDPDFYYVSGEGKMVPFNGDDRNSGIENLPGGYKNGYTDKYNIALSGTTTNFQLPQMRGGRMYISLGRKLQVRLNDNIPQNPPLPPPQPPVNLAQPDGWTNVGDPNFKTLFDWLEFDYKVNVDTDKPGIGINKTEVDAFGFGVKFKLEGTDIGSKELGTVDGGRQLVLLDLAADPDFSKLIIPGPALGKREDGSEFQINTPIRIAAPVKGISNTVDGRTTSPYPTFVTNYFDSYLTDVWKYYEDNDLVCFTSAFGTWTGRVNKVSQLMEFNRTDKTGFQTIFVRKPNSTQAFEPTSLIQTDGITYQPVPGGPRVRVPDPPPLVPAPKDGDDPKLFTPYVANEIISAMSAALNRTTLLHQPLLTRDYRQHPADKTFFYLKDNLKAPKINLYAKSIHDHSLLNPPDAPGSPTSNGGGAAYAFGFDDSSNQSSFISDLTNPTHLTVEIQPVP